MSVFSKENLIFFVLIILISLATFWRAFDINLRADDFIIIWVASNPLYENLTFIVDDLFKLHPVLTIHATILAKFFGFNPFYWQLSGFFLKVVDSLVIALMMWGITGSKRVSFYSGLIFASFAGGLESFIWESGRAPAIIIAPLCLGIYFWFLSKGKFFNKNYLLSLFFFFITVILDPGRGIMIIVLTFLWDSLTLLNLLSKENIMASIKRLTLLAFLVFAELFLFKEFTTRILKVGDFTTSGQVAFLSTALQYIPTHLFRSFTNFMYSMGNLLAGWFNTSMFESGHFSRPNSLAMISSLFLILLLIIFLKKFILERDNTYKIFIFFLLWIPIVYFPNWLLTGYYTGDDGLIVGFSHRYLAISSVGLVCFLGYFAATQKKALSILILSFIIISNVLAANRILKQELFSRSAKLAEGLWDQIDREVPKGEKDSIFIFKGGNPVFYELVGSDAIPFGLRRGVDKIEDLPIIRVERDTVRKLLCETGVLHFNALRDLVPNKKIIPLANVYAWKFENNMLINITSEERQALAREVECKTSF